MNSKKPKQTQIKNLEKSEQTKTKPKKPKQTQINSNKPEQIEINSNKLK